MRLTLLIAVAVVTAWAASALTLAANEPAQPAPPFQKVVPRPANIVPREEWGSQPQPFPDSRKHTPNRVTIHHAGVDYKPGTDPAKFVKNMQGWGQRDKGWPDLPYHFLIAPDGRIFEARDLQYEPDTNTKYDLTGHIGVEMMGNFQTQRVSPQQLESCVNLVAWLCQEFSIDPTREKIGGHRDVAPQQTTCPGKDFYRYLEGDAQFIEWVKRTLAGKDPQINPGPPLPDGPVVVVGTPTTRPTTNP